MEFTKLTKVTDAVLMEIRDKSDNPIYDIDKNDHGHCWEVFRKRFPGINPRNGLTIRACLAGDVEIVNSGRHKYILVLATEIDLLERRNREVKAYNREVRAFNKMIRLQQKEAALKWAEENGLGDIVRMMVR